MIEAIANYHPVADPGEADMLPDSYDAGATCEGSETYTRPGESENSAWWYKEAGSPDLVVLYVQGLGFMSPIFPASVPQHILRQATLGGVVVGIDYQGGPANPWPAGRDDVVAAHDWAAAKWPGVAVVYVGHSAGAHYAAHAAQYHDVPWVGINGFYWWQGLGDEGGAYWTNAGLARDRQFYPSGTPVAAADVEFATDGPDAYLIGSDSDDVCHPSESLEACDVLKAKGVALWHDNVDTGAMSDRNHEPWGAVNMTALDAWFDLQAGR